MADLPTFEELLAAQGDTPSLNLSSNVTNTDTGVQLADGSGFVSGVNPYTAPDLEAERSAQERAAALSSYDTQANNLRSLLGRTETGLNQGLSQLNDSYVSNKTQRENERGQALQDYSDKRVSTNKDRQVAYNTINKNGNTGYRSLAQIIGRAAGTGSSAFRDLLPDAVGRDTSGQRSSANDIYASNLGNIDNAQKKTENSFASILQDLENQRRGQEQKLRTGVETQRQDIYGQLGSIEAQRIAAAGGSQAAITAAQQPYQQAIDNSRNSVEGFFSQFRPTLTAQQAPVEAANLSNYNVDRTNINAQRQGGDATNPYADILRKRMQERQA